MTGVVFLETLRRKWRHSLYWGIGLALYAVFTFALNPDTEALDEMVDVIADMGPIVSGVLGVADVEIIGTMEGFIGLKFFAFLLVITGVYGIGAGLEVTANDEAAGILDMELSLPVARWRIVAEKSLAYCLLILGLSLMTFLGLIAGRAVASSPVDIATTSLLEGALNFAPATIVIMTVTVVLGVLTRRRIIALGLASVFVALSYALNTVADVTKNDAGDAFAQISVFKHYSGATILTEGLSFGAVLLLAGAAFLLSGVAIAAFRRRDIAV